MSNKDEVYMIDLSAKFNYGSAGLRNSAACNEKCRIVLKRIKIKTFLYSERS